MSDVISPGGVVGILGGGQLGRMLAIAAAQLGLRAHIYAPEENPPAGDVAKVTRGAWDDAAALGAFARSVDVVTFEFENVPASVVDALEAFAPVRPGRKALAVAQERLEEKTFLNAAGVATAPFAPVDDEAGLKAALAKIGAPSVLKTRRLGYDGKGQARIMTADDAPAAFAAMNGAPAILEGFVEFRREISIIAARGADGAVAAYDPAENIHENGILRRSTVPAASSPEVVKAAAEIAGRILTALDYTGVIGVEFFELPSGELLVNEIAPRVHNTGHWTIEATANDQFRQHIRAICLWPLADPSRHCDAVMENLIGDEAGNWPTIANEPGAAIHLYGKGEARQGRKMGHVTRLKGFGEKPLNQRDH